MVGWGAGTGDVEEREELLRGKGLDEDRGTIKEIRNVSP